MIGKPDRQAGSHNEKKIAQSPSQITFNHFTGGNNQVNSPGASMKVSTQLPGGASEESAKEQLKDWPKAKRNRKWTLMWTVMGVVVGLAALYFAWKSLS